MTSLHEYIYYVRADANQLYIITVLNYSKMFRLFFR